MMTPTTRSDVNLLPATTTTAGVRLLVADLDAMTAFYRDVLLLDALEQRPGGEVVLGRRGGVLGHGGVLGEDGRDLPLVTLVHAPDLPRGERRGAGLFHVALLHKDHADLAETLASVAVRAPQLYTGAGDHHVSEAFYLDDIEGNGVELYVDRPRDQWIWRDGQVYMTTEYIDANAFLADHLTDAARERLATADPDARAREAGTTIGHVHLRVGNLPEARDFYVDTLGLEETTALGDQALFVSAGGYHHHLAMNTWHSLGAGARVPELGLGRVDLAVPGVADVDAAAARLRAAGLAVRASDEGAGAAIEVEDPWNNLVRVAARG